MVLVSIVSFAPAQMKRVNETMNHKGRSDAEASWFALSAESYVSSDGSPFPGAGDRLARRKAN